MPEALKEYYTNIIMQQFIFLFFYFFIFYIFVLLFLPIYFATLLFYNIVLSNKGIKGLIFTLLFSSINRIHGVVDVKLLQTCHISN